MWPWRAQYPVTFCILKWCVIPVHQTTLRRIREENHFHIHRRWKLTCFVASYDTLLLISIQSRLIPLNTRFIISVHHRIYLQSCLLSWSFRITFSYSFFVLHILAIYSGALTCVAPQSYLADDIHYEASQYAVLFNPLFLPLSKICYSLMCSMSVHYIIRNTNHQQMHKESFIINCNTLLQVSTLLGHFQWELFVTVTLRLHFIVEWKCAVDCVLRCFWRRVISAVPACTASGESSRLQKKRSTQSRAHSHSTIKCNLRATLTKKFSLKMTQQGRNM
jgi:hypothetical protein